MACLASYKWEAPGILIHSLIYQIQTRHRPNTIPDMDTDMDTDADTGTYPHVAARRGTLCRTVGRVYGMVWYRISGTCHFIHTHTHIHIHPTDTALRSKRYAEAEDLLRVA